MKKFMFILLFVQFNASAEELLDEIVAVVDENVIMRSDLDRSIASISKQISSSGNQLPPADILEKQVLERPILQEIQVARADQASIRVSEAEIDATLSQIAQQNKITLSQMRQAIEQDGFKFSQFRNDMKREMLTERVRYAYANSEVKVSDHEIDLFLADNQLDQGEVDLEHILIATPPEASPSDIQTAQAEAEGLYDRIQLSQNFSVLAAKYSDGQKALEGGKLGWRPINQLPPLFSDQVKLMSVGESTHPIRSPSGFHILRLNDKRSKTTKMVEQFNALHIMIETNEIISPKEGMKIINNLHKKIKDGAEFSKIAEENSDDHSSAPLGGDLGWFEVNAFGDRFGNVMQGLNDGEISQPFQTEAGWHITKRIAKKEADVTKEFKRDQAKSSIRERKIQEAIEAWVRQVRGESFVDIRI